MKKLPFNKKQTIPQPIESAKSAPVLTEEQAWDKIIPNIILKGTFLSTMSFSVSGESFAIRVTPQQKLELQMYSEEYFDTLNVDEKILEKIYKQLTKLNDARIAELKIEQERTNQNYKLFISRIR